MKAGIAIEEWKLPIFRKHLEEAGYSFKSTPNINGSSESVLWLAVEFSPGDNKLPEVIRKANDEARRSRSH